MSYNIKDFWLKFDGESGSIANEGAKLNQAALERLEMAAGVIRGEKPKPPSSDSPTK